jgi:hypothetical protein
MTETNDDDDTHTQHNNGWPTPHATTHTTIRQENKPQQPSNSTTPNQDRHQHHRNDIKDMHPRQQNSNDQDQSTETHGPSTQLPAHIHKVIGVKGRETQLPAHIHKVIRVKERERRTLTQINFWTNQPMEKSHEMTTKSSSKFPGTNANFQILANQWRNFKPDTGFQSFQVKKRDIAAHLHNTRWGEHKKTTGMDALW